LFTTPNGEMAFLDAAGTSLISVQHDPPINPMLDDQTTMGWAPSTWDLQIDGKRDGLSEARRYA
jgi:hypothetical protein